MSVVLNSFNCFNILVAAGGEGQKERKGTPNAE